jgi:hypothetical protein
LNTFCSSDSTFIFDAQRARYGDYLNRPTVGCKYSGLTPFRYGRARIEPVNSRDDVSDYCAKYVTKENTWWGVNLLGQRHPAFKDFKLE